MLADLVLSITLLEKDSALAALGERISSACHAVRAEHASVELSWGRAVAASSVRALPSASDEKQFYAAWLKTKYAYQIGKLNEAYGTEFTSFTDLTESDFRSLDERRAAVVGDDKAFWADYEAYVASRTEEACGRKVEWKRKRT